MKKTILYALLAFCVNAAIAQSKTAKKSAPAGVTVPGPVETRFGSDYPNTSATWSMDGKNYVATFKDRNGNGKTVVYDKKADFVRSDMESAAGFPQGITDYYSKKFPKEKFTVWFSNDDFGEPLYYTKRKGKILWFDKNGNFSAKRPGKYKS